VDFAQNWFPQKRKAPPRPSR